MEQDFVQYKCGYCGWLISSACEDYTKHRCFSLYDETLHQFVADHNNILTFSNKEVPVEKSNNNINDNFDEQIIELVSERPALYDHRLTLSQRSLAKRNALWQEIYNNMGGAMPVNDIKKRWQYLRDTYVKINKKINEHVPSGSSQVSLEKLKPNFPYYHRLKFLNDPLERNPTVSSVSTNVLKQKLLDPRSSEKDLSVLVTTPEPSPTENPHETPPAREKRTKRKNEEKNTKFQEAIINILSEPQAQNSTRGLDGFLARLREGLERLPFTKRCQIEMNILQMLLEAETENI